MVNNYLPLNLAISSRDKYDFVSWTHVEVLSLILSQVLDFFLTKNKIFLVYLST